MAALKLVTTMAYRWTMLQIGEFIQTVIVCSVVFFTVHYCNGDACLIVDFLIIISFT